MIRDTDYWQQWERGQSRTAAGGYDRNAAVVARLMREARALGRWPPADSLAGLEEKVLWLRELDGRDNVSHSGAGP